MVYFPSYLFFFFFLSLMALLHSKWTPKDPLPWVGVVTAEPRKEINFRLLSFEMDFKEEYFGSWKT